MTDDLADRSCVPPETGTQPFSPDEQAAWLERLGHDWSLRDGRLVKRYAFPDFAQALAFVNAVGAEAEAVGHHPDIALGWGRVELSLTTHDIGGLAECDFVLAARCERLHQTPA